MRTLWAASTPTPRHRPPLDSVPPPDTTAGALTQCRDQRPTRPLPQGPGCRVGVWSGLWMLGVTRRCPIWALTDSNHAEGPWGSSTNRERHDEEGVAGPRHPWPMHGLPEGNGRCRVGDRPCHPRQVGCVSMSVQQSTSLPPVQRLEGNGSSGSPGRVREDQTHRWLRVPEAGLSHMRVVAQRQTGRRRRILLQSVTGRPSTETRTAQETRTAHRSAVVASDGRPMDSRYR